MRALLSVLALGLSTPASAASDPTPVVFIHGIKGARLVAPDGETHWISGLQSLGLRTPDLALPLTWDGPQGTQTRDRLAPGGVLDRIVFLPRLWAAEVYGPWLEGAATRLGGRPFRAFAYDWRRDNLETLAAFERFVVDAAGGNPVHVVAHSMGGLVTLALLNSRPELFASVTFAGVPFPGGVGFLLDLHAGTRAGLNGRIAGPPVLATFPSVYALFPESGESPLREVGGLTPIPVDFFSAADWRRLALGPFAAEPPGGSETFAAFLGHALGRAGEFRRRLIPSPAARARSLPPVLAVLSRAHPTLGQAVRGGPSAVKGWDFESAPRVPGDGRVTAPDATPPAFLAAAIVETAREHSELLNDPVVIDAILRHLDAATAAR